MISLNETLASRIVAHGEIHPAPDIRQRCVLYVAETQRREIAGAYFACGIYEQMLSSSPASEDFGAFHLVERAHFWKLSTAICGHMKLTQFFDVGLCQQQFFACFRQLPARHWLDQPELVDLQRAGELVEVAIELLFDHGTRRHRGHHGVEAFLQRKPKCSDRSIVRSGHTPLTIAFDPIRMIQADAERPQTGSFEFLSL